MLKFSENETSDHPIATGEPEPEVESLIFTQMILLFFIALRSN